MDAFIASCSGIQDFLDVYEEGMDKVFFYYAAAKYGKFDILYYMIHTMNFEIANNWSALMIAIHNKHWFVARLLWTDTNSVLDPLFRYTEDNDWYFFVRTNIETYLRAAKNNDLVQMLDCIRMDPHVIKGVEDVHYGDEDLEVYSALDLAAKYGHLEIIKHLRRHGYLGPHDTSLRRLCRIAAEHGHGSVVTHIFNRMGMEQDGDVRTTTNSFMTHSAIRLALMNKHFDVVKYLSQVSVQSELVTLVMDLVSERDLANLKNLYKSTSPEFFDSIVDGGGFTPLILAARQGSIPAMRFLMKKVKVDSKDDRGNSAVAIAIMFGRYDKVKILVEEGGASLKDMVMDGNVLPNNVLYHLSTEVDANGDTAFHHIVDDNNLEVAKWVANLVGTVSRVGNAKSMSPLMYALQNNNLEMAHWLINSGHADVNDIVMVETGDTALLLAARHHWISLFVDLVEETGADLTLSNHAGQTIWEHFYLPHMSPRELNLVLLIMLARVEPPEHIVDYLIDDHSQLLSEATKLRRLIGPYLKKRKILVKRMVLSSDVAKKIFAFEKRLTTDEIWATGLGDLAPYG
jgi:ankyrin repeat protein